MRIALLYLLFGILWILLTDLAVNRLFPQIFDAQAAQTAKGLIYVLLTTSLVYWLARRAMLRMEADLLARQLREAEELMKAVIANLGEAVLIVDPTDRTITSCNKTVETVFGYTCDELIGHGSEILHLDEESYRRFAEIGEPVLDRDGVFRTDYRMRRKDGGEIETEITVITLHRTLGWRSGVVSIVRDISELISAQRALQESEERYRLLAENTMDVIWAMRPDMHIVYVNPIIGELTGKGPQEWIGTDFSAHAGAAALAKVREIVREEIEQGPESPGRIFELELPHKEGDTITFEVRARMVFDEQGEPLLMQGVSRDVTERRRLQEERRRIEERLREGQRMEAVGRLAGGIAHDFNNLLSIIVGCAEDLRSAVKHDEAHLESAEDILAASNRSAELIRQLLAFSRRQPMQPQVLNLNDILRNMDRLLQRLIGKTITPRIELARDLPAVEVDPGQIEQVVMNLATNARQAMPNGGELRIETSRFQVDEGNEHANPTVEPGIYCQLRISDTGHGMGEEVKQNLFEPFFTTREAGRGTGLGLATVYGIIRQSGGHIEVFSEPGEGATFEILLPAAKRLQKPATEAAVANTTSLTAATGKQTILVVQDEEPMRRLLGKMLAKLPYRAMIVDGAEEALRVVKGDGFVPDLVISDIVMPGMGGKQLVAQLRDMLPLLKVLFMSGYSSDVLKNGEEPTETPPLLHKPFGLDDLRAAIEAILGKPEDQVGTSA